MVDFSPLENILLLSRLQNMKYTNRKSKDLVDVLFFVFFLFFYKKPNQQRDNILS